MIRKTYKFNYMRFFTRDVNTKRNFFVFASFFQWFFRNLSLFAAIWRNKIKTISYARNSVRYKELMLSLTRSRSMPSIFFVTSHNFSFYKSFAKSLSATLPLSVFHLQWDPLFFFYSFSRIQAKTVEFFPIFFVDPTLLLNSVFKQNFFSIFIRYPMFYVGGFETMLISQFLRELRFMRRVYPIFVSSGYGFYLLVFFLRFLFNLV